MNSNTLVRGAAFCLLGIVSSRGVLAQVKPADIPAPTLRAASAGMVVDDPNLTWVDLKPFDKVPPTPKERSSNLYYVATDGDDGNTGTKDKPFKTIQHASTKPFPATVCSWRRGLC